MPRRRLFIILATVLAIAIIVAGVFLRLRQGPDTTPGPGESGALPVEGTLPGDGTATTTPGGLPPVAVLPAARGIIVDYFVRADGATAFIKPDGEIIVATTTSAIVSSVKIGNLLDAQFSNTGNFVLVKYGDPMRPDWSAYDLQKNSWKQLGIETRDADWAPDADTIAYVAVRTSSAALSTLDVRPTTLRPRALVTLSGEDLVAKWAGSSRIILFTRPSATVPGTLFAYDLRTSRMTPMFENVKGADIRWGSADRGLILHTKSGRGSAELYLIDADGREVQAFSFLTMPHKCLFDGPSRLLCGIPKDVAGFRQNDLPDAYLKREFFTADALYAIDLDSGSFEAIADEVGADHDMSRVKRFGNAVYFVNRSDSLLYKIELANEEANG